MLPRKHFANALLIRPQKFVLVWIEAFFIMACTWSLGTLLERKPRKMFNEELREAIKKHKTDLVSVQKNRPKRNLKREEDFLNDLTLDF